MRLWQLEEEYLTNKPEKDAMLECLTGKSNAVFSLELNSYTLF